MDYKDVILLQLDKIEHFSLKYQQELLFLSKRIRNDIWVPNGERYLAYILNAINEIYDIFYQDRDLFDLNSVTQIVSILERYGLWINPELNDDFFHRLQCDIHMENARVIVGRQWENILDSENGSKSFIDVFGDVFDKCMVIRREAFFHELGHGEVLCRAVSGWGYDENRFIPWPNKVQNRWNPPGKTYLYLSYSEQDQKYDGNISLNEYICLEEIRAKEGNQYSTCLFEAVNKGCILDLSYNDIELWEIDNDLNTYSDKITDIIIKKITSDYEKMDVYKYDKRKLRRDIKKESRQNVDKAIISDNIAYRYLKMICEVIYKKVDVRTDNEKEKQYRSFHILAQYLEERGITGIIYPCTRTKNVVGKNIVLFNVDDATPIIGTIREIVF